MVSRLHFLALMFLCTLSAQIDMNVPFTRHNTVLFFDLHDVVLKPDTGKRIQLAIKNPLTALGLGLRSLTNQHYANGEAHQLHLKNKGLHQKAAVVRSLSAAYKVDTDVYEILKNIKANGYRLCMASNIGRNNLNDLCDPKHPQNQKRPGKVTLQQAIGLFDDLVFVDYESQEVISKPDPRYYAIVQDRCGHDKRVVFVDDNKKNIIAAQESGLHSIRFTSARQLQKDLQTIGII